MNRYSYICIDKNGQEVLGVINASNDEAARIRLMEQGFKIVRLDLSAAENTPASDHLSEIEEVLGDELAEYGKEVWNMDTEFIDQTSPHAQLNYKEMPLSASLYTLAEETSSRRLAHTFESIARDLEQGTSVEKSFSQHLNHVPENLESLIRIGTQSGNLETIIEDYIETQRLLRQALHRVSISLFYASVLVFGSCFLFYFLMSIVVPNFKDLFLDFGVELPGITLLALNLSDLISAFGLTACIILIAGGLLLWFSFDLFQLQAVRRRIINRVPVLGSIFKFTSLSQFCRMLATMIEAQIKLPEAIEIAAKTTKDPNLIAGCRVLNQRINEGFNLSEASLALPHFSKNFPQLFRWHNRPDIFIDSLRASSNIFQAKANMKTGTLLFGLQPVVLLGIVVTIGFTVLAVYIPLIKVLNDLS